jgi:high affinity Mn2+ porin
MCSRCWIRNPPPDTQDDAEQGSRFGWPADDESRFVARAQATYAWIRKFGFDAPYTGPQSLVTHPESSYTLSFTGFLGARLWEGGELYIDPEAFQAHPLSNLFGLAGIQNGELQKASGVEIRAYFARAFIRQSFEFGGESREIPAGSNQLATHYDSRRLVFSVGKFPLTDFFERSSYANDPRTQFMNWALITYGAYDYAADARGYDIGAIAELYWDDWAFRAGRGMEPTIANGRSLYYNFRRHGDQVEIEHDHVFHGQPGAVRILVYRNLANAGNYRESVALAVASGTIPDITATRSLEAKTGYGMSVEQSLSPSVALWARGMWCDCNVEQYAFTEIDNSMSAGVSIKGSLWQRSHDTVGAAFSLNGLSPAHRAYLAAGGLGGFLGDGRLNYTREQDYEIYYSALVYRGVHLKQTTPVSTGFERHRKTTHRAQFPTQMRQIVPWTRLCTLIEPHCREGLTRPPAQLRAAGLKLSVGSIVDASIISAPSWVQRKEHAREPQRHQLGAPKAALP